MLAAHLASEHSIINYGVSEQLKAEFDLLRDIPGAKASFKFTSKTVDTLAQHLVCRNYGNLCYEFVHLNWALIFTHAQRPTRGSIEHSLLDYYWISQCTSPRSFMAHFMPADERFMDTTGEPIAVIVNTHTSTQHPASIKVVIHDHSFTISASRANLLACMMEWLICVIPDVLALIENALLGKGHNAISEFSSFLQKRIYAYLADCLPPAKLQLRFRLMQAWFTQNGAHSQSIVNDENLLNFWMQHKHQEGYGKYSSVLKDSLSYLQALDIAQTSMSLHYTYSSEDQAEQGGDDLFENDVDSASLFNASMQYVSVYSINVRALSAHPKALTKGQLEYVELLALYPQYIAALSLSWLRGQVFGKVQHQIIQSLRMKQASQYPTLIEQNYQDIRRAAIDLMASNQQTLLAIVDILRADSPNQACLILLKLMSSLAAQQSNIRIFTDLLNTVSDVGINASNLAAWQLAHPWLKSLLGECQRARKHINREGFTHKTLRSAQDYLSCAEGLFDVNKSIKQVVTHINKKEQHKDENFVADRLIFLNEFTTLYLSGEL